jgi:hypothetical protein
MAEGPLVQDLRVLASTGQLGGDGRLPVTEDPPDFGRVQPFGQRREHPCDLLRRGVQPVQGSVAPGSERGMAGRASKRLNPLSRAMLAIAEKPRGSEHRRCRSRGTGGWDKRNHRCSPAWALPGGFSSHAKAAQAEALVPQQMNGRRRGDRQGSPEGCGA